MNSIPALLPAAIGSLVRALLAAAAGYVVAEGWWSPEEADRYVGELALALTAFLAALIWSIYQKYIAAAALDLGINEAAPGTPPSVVKDAAKKGISVNTAMTQSLKVLLVASLLAGTAACASRQYTDPAVRAAATASDVMDTTKVLVQTVTAAELALAPAQKAAVADTLDQFYMRAYNIGEQGERLADLLVLYKNTTDAASKGTIVERINAVLPGLTYSLEELLNLNLTPVNTTEIAKLLQNLSALVETIKQRATAIPDVDTSAMRYRRLPAVA